MNISQSIYKANKLNQQAGSTAAEKLINSLNKKTSTEQDVDENGNALSAEERIKKFTQDLSDSIKHIFDPTNGMSDAQKEKYRKKIMAKIESGKELTPEEMRYVQINMPDLYPHVVRIQIQRKSLEESLKHCESKEEAQKVYDQAVSNISEKDPMAKQLAAAYDDVMKEYKKSDGYAALPATEEEAEEKKQGHKVLHSVNDHSDLLDTLISDDKKPETTQEDSKSTVQEDLNNAGGAEGQMDLSIKTEQTANTIDSSYFPADNMSISSMNVTA